MSEKQAVKFTALMKEMKIKSLESCDKAVRLVLDIATPEDGNIDGVIADLNALMKADTTVNVGVWK